MDYISGINPMSAISSSMIPVGQIRTRNEANKAFVSLFLSQILKNVMNSENELYSKNEITGLSNNLYNEILIKKIADDLASSNDFNINGDRLNAQARTFNRIGGY